MDMQMVAAAVAGVNGVVSTQAWTKVAGRERCYFKLQRYNGVSCTLTDGAGVEGWVDNQGEVYLQGGGHNASVYYHRENGTIKAIGRAVRGCSGLAPMTMTPEEEAEKEDHIR